MTILEFFVSQVKKWAVAESFLQLGTGFSGGCRCREV